ncbi:unnamed protein product [Paramecium sonneborni]|uniref:Transmembrane protein n=1 Tax=Paramecium sonneborni TaxID=65129 RepID=A0A8S1RH04_9CILI|nr:unnamed protein product [Paramecium sonneborni]
MAQALVHQLINLDNNALPIQMDETFSINYKQYHQIGQQNQQTSQLLEILRNQQTRNEADIFQNFPKLKSLVDYLRQLYYEIYLIKREIKISEQIRFNLQIQFNTYDLIINIVFWSIFLCVIAESIQLQNDDNIQDSYFRLDILLNLPIYSFLFAIFSLICQNIQKKFLWLILFLFLILIPFFVMIGYLQNQSNDQEINYTGIGYCILSFIIFLNSMINQVMNNYLVRISSKLIATIYNCGFAYLQFTQFFLNYQQQFQAQIMIQQKLYSSNSFYYYFCIIKINFLQLSPEQIQMDLKLLIQVTQIDSQIQTEFLQKIDKLFSKIKEKLKLKQTAPILIIICYTILELFCYILTFYQLNQGDIELTIAFAVYFGNTIIFIFNYYYDKFRVSCSQFISLVDIILYCCFGCYMSKILKSIIEYQLFEIIISYNWKLTFS